MDILELCQAIIDGKNLQIFPQESCGLEKAPDWRMASPIEVIKQFVKNPHWVRIAPKLKPIDLSVLIASGIDCEFNDCKGNKTWVIGRLIADDCGVQAPFMCELCAESFEWCRPRMDHWHACQGGECPLPEGLCVKLSFRNGNKVTVSMNYVKCSAWLDEIIAFKIIGLGDGWCWPWECKK